MKEGTARRQGRISRIVVAELLLARLVGAVLLAEQLSTKHRSTVVAAIDQSASRGPAQQLHLLRSKRMSTRESLP